MKAYQRLGAEREPETETFSLWIPLVKSSTETDEEGKLVRFVEGLASSEHKDQQGETILQRGIDYDPLMRGGYINWDHERGPDNIIGEPSEAGLHETKRGWGLFFKGFLYEGHKRAEAAWDLLKAQERAQQQGHGHRTLGWSVEGGVVGRATRDQSIIAKSVVRFMALTHQPVNAESYTEISKSFGRIWTQNDTFDPRSNVHHAFNDIDALTKAFGAVGSEQTLYKTAYAGEGMGGSSMSSIMDNVIGAMGRGCKGSCSDEKLGRRKALRHFVECNGGDVDDSYNAIKEMYDFLMQ